MQNLGGGGGGQIRCTMGNVRVANGAIHVLRISNLLGFSDFPLQMLIKSAFLPGILFNRPIRLTQCCTQFLNSSPLGIKRFVSGISISHVNATL